MKYIQLLIMSFILAATSANALDYAASATKTSGVAPLPVTFYADLTASTSSAQTFHTYKYVWNFDDTGSGTWAIDGMSKNVAYGPVAAHVFEDAGTYDVTLTVYDSSDGSIVTSLAETFQVVVTDQDSYFSGYDTTCISSTAQADFSGCPSGSRQVTTDNLASALPGYMGAGERVLLDRGSSWNVTTSIGWSSHAGLTVLGAYGTCVGEDNLGICTNAPEINVSNYTFISGTGKQNWTFQDIEFNGTSGIDLLSGNRNVRQWTFSRLKTTGFNRVSNVGHYRYSNSDNNEEFTVYSCNVDQPYFYGHYFVGQHVNILGNIMDYPDAQHLIRLKVMNRNVIQHNRLSGAINGTHVLKLHSMGEKDLGVYGTTTGDPGDSWLYRSEFFIISDNEINSSGVASVAIAPQNATSDERISDYIYERNIITNFGTRASLAYELMYSCADYVTIRNNVFDLTGRNNTVYGLVIKREGVEPSHDGAYIYNNTFYSYNSGSYSRAAISITSGDDLKVKNNFISFPGSTGVANLFTTGTQARIDEESNNVINNSSGLFTDPNNANPLDKDFSLTSSAIVAIDSGTSVPLLDDAILEDRNYPFDLGAYEYTTGGIPDTTPPNRTQLEPAAELPYGTTDTDLEVVTDEEADCEWNLVGGLAYGHASQTSMSSVAIGGGYYRHSYNLTGITPTYSETVYYRCQDTSYNANTSDVSTNITVASASDTTPPVPSDYWPTSALDSSLTWSYVSFLTDELAQCRYTLTSGTPWESMTIYGNEGDESIAKRLAHQMTVTGLTPGSFTPVYNLCEDASSNRMTSYYTITVEVSTRGDTVQSVGTGTVSQVSGGIVSQSN